MITEVGGKPVAGGEELIVRIRSHRPGDELGLTVLDGGVSGARADGAGDARLRHRLTPGARAGSRSRAVGGYRDIWLQEPWTE